MISKRRILLYGATGFSGRLIAEEAARQRSRGDIELVLASRDKQALSRIADDLKLPWVAFSLDDAQRVAAALQGFKVLINAAGPFSATAERLAKSAIGAGCHYVDINGEVDVYKRLDDLDYIAKDRSIVLVCGAGHTAALSDLLLDTALGTLAKSCEIGTIRIAVECMKFLSRGSAKTMMRMVREQVTVARTQQINGRERLALSHLPVGKLDRTFDFGPREKKSPLRIASAANLIDTLTALHTIERREVKVQGIESYIAMPGWLRNAYQAGAFAAFTFQLPGLRQLNRWQTDLLPDGPDADERQDNTHRVVLEIEDRYRTKVVDWCLATGDPYELTARVALAVARNVGNDPKLKGWQTPAAVLGPLKTPLPQASDDPTAGCRWLHRRP